MLVFNEAQSLSLQHRLEYLGDAFNYRNIQDFSVRGRMISNNSTDETNAIGFSYVGSSGLWVPMGGGTPFASGYYDSLVGHLIFDDGYSYIDLQAFQGLPEGQQHPLYDIWEGMDNVKNQFSDFQEIILNGSSLGSGRVKSIKFPESRDSTSSFYEVEFEIYKDGNLYNFAGSNYNNSLDFDICKYVEGLEESFQFDYAKDGVINYSRNLSFNLINPNLSEGLYLSGVKELASGLFYNNPQFSNAVSQFPNFYESNGNRLFSESYDIYQGKFSFNEEFQGGESGKGYYWNKNYSLSFGENGVNNVTENGSVNGLFKNKYESAKSGINEVFSTSQQRIEDFYNSYVGLSCSDEIKLKSSFKKADSGAGKIDYSLVYDNDPFDSIGYYVNRSFDIEKTQNGIFQASERGSITSSIGNNTNERLENAIYYFKNNIESGIEGRIFDFYDDFPDFCGCSGTKSNNDLSLFSKDMTFEESESTVSYNHQYKTYCDYEIYQDFLISFEKQVKDTVHNVAVELTPYSGELAQPQNTSSLINEIQNIVAIGSKNTLSIEDYIGACSQRISPPSSNTFYMNSCNYSYYPDESRMEMSVSFNYTGFRAYNNYNV